MSDTKPQPKMVDGVPECTDACRHYGETEEYNDAVPPNCWRVDINEPCIDAIIAQRDEWKARFEALLKEVQHNDMPIDEWLLQLPIDGGAK